MPISSKLTFDRSLNLLDEEMGMNLGEGIPPESFTT
jgi:hypothetical protein